MGTCSAQVGREGSEGGRGLKAGEPMKKNLEALPTELLSHFRLQTDTRHATLGQLGL